MIRRGHAVLPLAALAALALPAAAFCEAAGRYVPTYDAEKVWYLGELGVTNLLNAGITGRGVRVGVIDLGVGDIVTGAHTNLHCAAKGGKSMRAMHGPAVAGIIASDLYGVAPDPAARRARPLTLPAIAGRRATLSCIVGAGGF